MGKSHLSQAIGHYILSEHPAESVYYMTAEDFSAEMVGAFREDSVDRFKEKYRKGCDVLLLEDIHQLSGKERTQIELAMTLDFLLEADKKIIFSSCYRLSDIPKISDKLRSRLSYGLTSTIDPPDFRTRVRILKKKAFSYDTQVPGEVLGYLASELTEDVRQLESGLVGVSAKSSLMGMPIDLDLAASVVQHIIRQQKKITVETIKKLICRHYNITVIDIVSRSRKQAVVRPRQIAMYLSRRNTDSPLQVIGKSFNRYHATVLHAIGSIEKGIRRNGAIKKQVDYLQKKLETGEF
jgi:chromosomal replication initiator protein